MSDDRDRADITACLTSLASSIVHEDAPEHADTLMEWSTTKFGRTICMEHIEQLKSMITQLCNDIGAESTRILLLRTLRNLTITPQMQQLMIPFISSLISCLIHMTSISMLRSGLQLLSNMMTSNDEIQSIMWDLLIPTGHLMTWVIHEDMHIYSIATSIIYMMCVNNIHRTKQLMDNKDIIIMILTRYTEFTQQQHQQQHDSTSAPPTKPSTPYSDWVHLLIIHCFHHDARLCEIIFGGKHVPISPTALSLLDILDAHVIGDAEYSDKPTPELVTTCVFLISWLGIQTKEEEMIMKTNPLMPSAPPMPTLHLTNMTPSLLSATHRIIQILSSITSHLHDHILYDALYDVDVISVVLRVLRHADGMDIKVEPATGVDIPIQQQHEHEHENEYEHEHGTVEEVDEHQMDEKQVHVTDVTSSRTEQQTLLQSDESASSSPTSNIPLPPQGARKPRPIYNSPYMFATDCIRLLANLAYHHIKIQSAMGELDGLYDLLNHCRYDDHNPSIREYAILAMRNCTEDHLENQSRIASLQIQSVANQEELQSMGLQAELDAETGKIRMTKISKNG